MKKIASVELLRFISAIMVIIWHYQQFYFPYNFFSDTEILISNRNQQPFYNFLSLFYNYGNKGVDFFFIISGYVFAYVYLVDNKKISLKFFFINRFARLYPLHFLTLIVVLLLQFYSIKSYDNYLVHLYNDTYHFFLNLFFISGWGLEKGLSFNGPIWSVSIEIIIYFLFFFLIINIKKNRILKSILIVSALIFVRKLSSDITLQYINKNLLSCGILFFEGVLVHYLVNKIREKKIIFIIGIILLIFSVIGNFKIYIFLPSVLIIFLSFENLIKVKMSSIFSFLGNLTYGTYLWHLPLQILMMIIIKNTELNISIIDTKIFFLVYFSLVILLSIVSYYFFEKKMREWLKKKYN
jgi:peptidoglycan/LPS O-acetylase OafA/YrhL